MRRFAIFFAEFTAAVWVFLFALVRIGQPLIGIAFGCAGSFSWLVIWLGNLHRYGKKSFWLLFGMPFGLFWALYVFRWVKGEMIGDPRWIAP